MDIPNEIYLENLYKLEERVKSLTLDYTNDNPADVARLIHDNLYKMTLDEKLQTYSSIVDELKLDADLLRFELYNLKVAPEEKTDDFNLLTQKITKIINRYQWKAGGFLYEDNEWTLYTKNNTKYELRDGEIIFDNSLKLLHKNDLETYKFTRQIINIIKQLSDKFEVKMKSIVDYDYEMCWMIIMIKKKIE